jgi:hypothetical protein
VLNENLMESVLNRDNLKGAYSGVGGTILAAATNGVP